AGILSELFRINREVRQWDPLSPLLYILAFEPFLRTIKANLRGIQINNDCFKVVAYVDDMTVGLVIVPLMDNARRTELEGEGAFKKLEEGESITVLGCTLDITGKIDKNIWPNLIGRPPSYKQVKVLNELISNWIKDKSRTLPRMSIYQQDYEFGGLKAPIIEHMMDARLT
ncbi:1692_t:CDS:2, partial [Ambispora leptoticha]